MRFTRPLVQAALIATTALVVAVPAALSAGMHPVVGAHLSGMGEHGVVNLHVKSKSSQVCWVFELPTTKNITGASVRAGSKGTFVARLGKSYSAKGCAKVDPMVAQHLETKPGSYWVFVDTKGHPGELRGKLVVGMVHM